LKHSEPRLQDFTPQNLANTAWALAKLRLRPPAAWSACLLAACRRSLPAFGPMDLANVAWALGNLGVRPPREWVDDFCLCARLQLGSFGSLATSTMLYGLAQMRHRPDGQLLAELLDQLQGGMRGFPANQLVDALRSLAMMGAAPQPAFVAEVRQLVSEGFFSAKQAAQVEQSLAVMAKAAAAAEAAAQQEQQQQPNGPQQAAGAA
jgi:hypothetical protein